MNRFLEMKERGETILFSELLDDIPADELFETGFHIWLLLNTQYPSQQQRDYIRDRHEDIMLHKIREDSATLQGLPTTFSRVHSTAPSGNSSIGWKVSP